MKTHGFVIVGIFWILALGAASTSFAQGQSNTLDDVDLNSNESLKEWFSKHREGFDELRGYAKAWVDIFESNKLDKQVIEFERIKSLAESLHVLSMTISAKGFVEILLDESENEKVGYLYLSKLTIPDPASFAVLEKIEERWYLFRKH